MCARAVAPLLVVLHRIARIKCLAPGLARAGFRERRDEPRMIGAGDRGHRIPVGVGSHSSAMLVRRTPCGNEMNFVQMKTALGGARYSEVADVNRIECAAKKRDAPLARLLSGNAVGFRRRDAQRSSVCGVAGEASDVPALAADSLSS